MPGRRQAIIWTNAGILLIGHLGTNFSEILIEIHIFSFMKFDFKNIVWKMAAILSRRQRVNQNRYTAYIVCMFEGMYFLCIYVHLYFSYWRLHITNFTFACGY